MASDSDINLLTVVGRINLKYVRDIKNTTIINKLNQYLDIHAGLNINKQRQSDFCKLQYVLSRGKSHGMESCKQMGRSNFYQQSHLEKIRNLLEKDVDIKEVTGLVKNIDKELVTNGSYVIIANLPHGVKSSNQGFLNTGKILLIKYGDNSGVEWYTIYNNKDSNDKTAISLEKQAKYILQNDGTYISSDEDAKKVRTKKEAAAATKIQALMRGEKERKKAEEGRARKQEEVIEKERIQEVLITGAKNKLINLFKTYPDSTFLQRVTHKVSPAEHMKRKIELIDDINTQIDIYNYNSTGLRVEPFNVDYLSKKSISTIRQALNVVISQMGARGGKSTRRRRRKMNPTQKIGHKKPKTKKKSNKGVINKRKTRSKK